ncbi:hypothetical protein F2Q69_00010243 [Brassica cretica]|uniref:Uncharacterized protein n=1 Tax=Brassica cretica TaxID=69181 RepID=A0A8S9QWX8_BRACR|nr:hypothetical protein F2Q69_00010243 [Brassica cretica]
MFKGAFNSFCASFLWCQSSDSHGSPLHSSVEIVRVWFCRRPPPVELWGVSQPPPSMPAWSHFGECLTDPTHRLFLLPQQVCSG